MLNAVNVSNPIPDRRFYHFLSKNSKQLFTAKVDLIADPDTMRG